MASLKWTRRHVLRTTALSAVGSALAGKFTGVLGASGATDPAELKLGPASEQQALPTAGRERLLSDFGWKFSLGHANDPAKDFGFGRGGIFAKAGNLIGGGRNSIAGANYDDRAWKSVDLPHDWAIDLPFVDDRGLDGHGYKPLGRTYPETSIGWYRRTFDIPAADAGRRISLTFDGVYRDATVVLNGHYLGRNLSGYTPVRYDVSDLLTYGGRNVLLVRVDATENEGWFYEGAGIYRHVWLDKTSPLHVAPNGIFITSTVHAGGSATVKVQIDVTNDQDTAVTTTVSTQIQGTTPASTPVTLGAWGTKTVTHTLTIPNAALWHVDAPALYKATVKIGRSDSVEETFGIRTIRFDADKGFFLNGKPLKIQGMCNHQDHAGVGAALPDALQEFRIKKLKEMGTNAYRSSHNPPTPELLDACDRLGMLVLDETRMMDASPEGLEQLERLILRDRNHPSVFAWSIGNEEPEQNTDRGARIGASMIRAARRLDPTRPITEANNGSAGWGGGLGPQLDVFGFNYSLGRTDEFHAKFPKQPTMGTEFASTVSTRGIYENDLTNGYVSAYDRNFPPWASTAETWWTHVAERPWLSGGFVWTGFDYRGEPTPYQWPCINSHFGILDMCGFPKDLFYYYKSWWGPATESVLHLFPHWNWPGRENQEVEVWCFTNCETVELFVNGVTAGWQRVERNGHAAWKVRYQPGAIEVRGRHANRAGILVDRRETTTAPAKLRLRADRDHLIADGEDTIVVSCEIQDADGRIVPTASNGVRFDVSGPARIIGVGNGDPSSHEADRATNRSAFNGLCMCLVQTLPGRAGATGEISVRADADGLTGATISVRATGGPRPSL